jgi:hypothetical protein
MNNYIPTLEGDEAEEFVRKAESAERATVDWSKQMKQMERILEKSRIANREPRTFASIKICNLLMFVLLLRLADKLQK